VVGSIVLLIVEEEGRTVEPEVNLATSSRVSLREGVDFSSLEGVIGRGAGIDWLGVRVSDGGLRALRALAVARVGASVAVDVDHASLSLIGSGSNSVVEGVNELGNFLSNNIDLEVNVSEENSLLNSVVDDGLELVALSILLNLDVIKGLLDIVNSLVNLLELAGARAGVADVASALGFSYGLAAGVAIPVAPSSDGSLGAGIELEGLGGGDQGVNSE